MLALEYILNLQVVARIYIWIILKTQLNKSLAALVKLLLRNGGTYFLIFTAVYLDKLLPGESAAAERPPSYLFAASVFHALADWGPW